MIAVRSGGPRMAVTRGGSIAAHASSAQSVSDHQGAADLLEVRLCRASQSAPRFPKPQEPQPSVAGPREEGHWCGGHSWKWGRDSNMQGSPEHFLHERRPLTHDTGHTTPRSDHLLLCGWTPVHPHGADAVPGQGRARLPQAAST